MKFLRISTVAWGIMGTAFALLMISARSALDVWWQISGIFGGGILGLFLLALLNMRLNKWQGILAIGVSVIVISWGTFARNLPNNYSWIECQIDPIIIGALGTGCLMVVAFLFGLFNRTNA